MPTLLLALSVDVLRMKSAWIHTQSAYMKCMP